MELKELKRRLRSAWSSKTSYSRHRWTTKNPAYGQCAVSALVVNDYLGGKIIWARVTLPSGEKVSHYFNRIGKRVVDVTRDQFSKNTRVPAGVERKKGYRSTRAYLLASSELRRRYRLLKSLVER